MRSSWKGCECSLTRTPCPTQLSRGRVHFEDPEAIEPGWPRVRHLWRPVYRIQPAIRLRPREIQLSLMFAMTCSVRNILHRVRLPCIASPPETGHASIHEETPLRRFSENILNLQPVAHPGRAAPSDGRAHASRYFGLQLLHHGSGVSTRRAASVTECLPRSRGFRSSKRGDAPARGRADHRDSSRLPQSADFSGALLHHWRGTAFAPGAKAADFERLMRDFNSYPQHFSPQVLQAKVLCA